MFVNDKKTTEVTVGPASSSFTSYCWLLRSLYFDTAALAGYTVYRGCRSSKLAIEIGRSSSKIAWCLLLRCWFNGWCFANMTQLLVMSGVNSYQHISVTWVFRNLSDRKVPHNWTSTHSVGINGFLRSPGVCNTLVQKHAAELLMLLFFRFVRSLKKQWILSLRIFWIEQKTYQGFLHWEALAVLTEEQPTICLWDSWSTNYGQQTPIKKEASINWGIRGLHWCTNLNFC